MMIRPLLVAAALFFAPLAAVAADGAWVSHEPSRGAYPLSTPTGKTQILYAAGDFPVVEIAVRDLQADLATVTGRTPDLKAGSAGDSAAKATIIVGTLGKNALIDGLVKNGKLKIGALSGAWESFVITTVSRPAPGIDQALVVVGSDRRGTAFGVYELSQAIGVSPWSWWADVTPQKHEALYVAAGLHRFGPPSVKYRGIFINDEDWGLHPWAANTFDPKLGDIGPKTYERVFSLLLRLKANTLWPAMHEVTGAFNTYPENRVLADRYAIVMGSSHAEPMLRNNVGEWKGTAAQFNYAANRDGVLDYWRERVKTNGAYENVYTLGMRGIHDSGMVGAGSLTDQKRLLEQIFADQRGLIAQHVRPEVEQVPQAFTAYKEVLEVYRAGLKVPDDVTLVWPDDNFGYIRQLPNAEERKRSGGSGVYYHLSYLGAPMSHLWLSTVPPALVIEEMGRAYDLGARNLWIANVGDIKPAEINTELFLNMAWDVDAVRTQGASGFLKTWASREFGADHVGAITSILERHHTLNFERKPEHLQWFLPGQRARQSDLSVRAAQRRLAQFDALTAEVAALEPAIAPALRDAFFQLVAYPVKGAALANHRFFDAEAYDRQFNSNPAEARKRGAMARKADADLAALTLHYNEGLAGGKWRGIMAVEPADGMWKSYRQVPVTLPAPGLVTETSATVRPLAAHDSTPPAPQTVVVQAEAFTAKTDVKGAAWRKIDGLGRGGAAMAAGPTVAASISAGGPQLDYAVTLPEGAWQWSVELIPTFPLNGQSALRLAAGIDGAEPVELSLARQAGDAVWAQGVLDGRVSIAGPAMVCGGARKVSLLMLDPGVTVDALVFRPAAADAVCR